MASHTVKFQSVSLTVAPWRHPSGRDYWRAVYHDTTGARHAITRSTLPKAKAAALAKAVELSRGSVDLSTLSAHQLRTLRRLLDADPTLAMVDDFLNWKAKSHPEKPAAEAVAEFLAAKKSNEGLSTQNGVTLKKHLKPFVAAFGQTPLASITLAQMELHLTANPNHGNETRRRVRASLVTFFRWCRVREFLPDSKTAAEKCEIPIVGDSIPETYDPAQLRLLLHAVRPDFLPWLATAVFAGVRTDEISPIPGSKKSPLAWSDFQWDRGIIIVRPETAKTKRRRVVPILPALRAWLYPIKKERGPIHAACAPTKRGKGKDAQAETARLGALIGGWKPNAIRHSFISYRAATPGVGLAQTAMEAGNSEAEARASYNDAKGPDEAAEWFAVMPGK
ncbi:hypothetical protein HQ447_05510 [bacterium]|nr:hypothetical protein [bacterium]